MEKIYSERFALRTSDFDMNGKIKPSAVLDLFQEVAGTHAKRLNIGFEELLEKNLLWVLVKVKFEVVGEIKMHTAVIVKTWPLKPSRVTLQRDYLIEDENGNVFIKGSSEWVTMNVETRRLTISNDIYPLEEFCEDRAIDGKISKISDFEAQKENKISPTPCEIDVNLHVNNIRYADYVMNLAGFDPQKNIKQFQIDFHREVKMQDTLCIKIKEEEKTLLAKGTSEENEKMFSCRIIY